MFVVVVVVVVVVIVCCVDLHHQRHVGNYSVQHEAGHYRRDFTISTGQSWVRQVSLEGGTSSLL